MLINKEKTRSELCPVTKLDWREHILITIQAENPESAKKLTETFVVKSDLSTLVEQQEYKFSIDKIELEDNDAFEC